jgi:non-specific serine/threonine protein kinase/serine/threonine-protein kinase
MDHPGIAQVHEAGETEIGHPYFVMEYVPGLPITMFCDRERLRIPERLVLFLQVCDAIQHAHQKGVIHRDIKPSNVVAAMRDGTPSAKVIDFGIVKATTTETMPGTTLMTREGMIIGTLQYMSPEQAGAASTVDTRSDIYSLGVLLYEMLTGSPPFEAERFRQATLPDAVRMIYEEDPRTLSAQLSQSGEVELAKIAERRSSDPRRLLRELKGELQWITFRAIEKNPDRRYASVAELAADIRRYLANEPVLAGAPSTMYRVRKYARRHRGRVIATGLVLAAIVAGGIATGIGFRRAVRAEHAARREAESAQRIADFLIELFKSSTPGRSGGETITARSLLEQGTRRIEAGATGDPQIRARLLRTIGEAHMGLGLQEEGLQLLAEALSTSESVQPRDDREIAQQLRASARGMMLAGKPDSACMLLDQTMSVLQEHGTVSDKAACLSEKAAVLATQGDLVPAESLLAIAIEMTKSEPEPDASLLLRMTGTMANVAHRKYDLDDAERHYLRLIELAQQIGEPTYLVRAHRGLAWLYMEQGEAEKSMQHADECVRMARKLYAPDHPNLAEALDAKSEALYGAGDIPQAIAVREEATGILRAKDVPDRLAHALNRLGLFYSYEEKYDLSIARLEEALGIRNRIYGPENARTAETLANLAQSCALAGMVQRSDSCFQAALSVFDRVDPSSVFNAYAHMQYANLCRDNRRIAAAETAYIRAEGLLDSTKAAMVPYRGECLVDHGYLRSLQGRHQEAESMIESGFAMQFGKNAKEDEKVGHAHVLWASTLAAGGNIGDAIEHLRIAARCGITAHDVAEYSELASLRSRPDYPFVNSP